MASSKKDTNKDSSGFKMINMTQTNKEKVPTSGPKKIVFCNICQKDYVTVQSLAKHFISGVHGSKKCNICEKPFSSVNAQIKHFVSEDHKIKETDAYIDTRLVSEKNQIKSNTSKTEIPAKNSATQQILKTILPNENGASQEKLKSSKAVFPNKNGANQGKLKSAKAVLPNKNGTNQEKLKSVFPNKNSATQPAQGKINTAKTVLPNKHMGAQEKSSAAKTLLPNKNGANQDKSNENTKKEGSPKQCGNFIDIDNKWCDICQIKFLSEDSFRKHTIEHEIKTPRKRTSTTDNNTNGKKLRTDIESLSKDTVVTNIEDKGDNCIENIITKVEKSFENYESLLQMVRLEWIDQISVPNSTNRLRNFVKYVMEDLKKIDQSMAEDTLLLTNGEHKQTKKQSEAVDGSNYVGGKDKIGKLRKDKIIIPKNYKENKLESTTSIASTFESIDIPVIKIEILTPEKKDIEQEKSLEENEVFHSEPEVLCEDTVEKQKEILEKMKKVFEEQKKVLMKTDHSVLEEDDALKHQSTPPEMKMNNSSHNKIDEQKKLSSHDISEKVKKVKKETENIISNSNKCDLSSKQKTRSKSTVIPQKDETNFGNLKDYLNEILNKLQKTDINKIFAKPVDIKDVPDYLDIIEIPMDFRTMRKKLNNFSYNCLKDLEDDFHIMINNCLEYNDEETIYHSEALKMKEKGACIINEVRTEALEQYSKSLNDPDLVASESNLNAVQDDNRIKYNNTINLPNLGNAKDSIQGKKNATKSNNRAFEKSNNRAFEKKNIKLINDPIHSIDKECEAKDMLNKNINEKIGDANLAKNKNTKKQDSPLNRKVTPKNGSNKKVLLKGEENSEEKDTANAKINEEIEENTNSTKMKTSKKPYSLHDRDGFQQGKKKHVLKAEKKSNKSINAKQKVDYTKRGLTKKIKSKGGNSKGNAKINHNINTNKPQKKRKSQKFEKPEGLASTLEKVLTNSKINHTLNTNKPQKKRKSQKFEKGEGLASTLEKVLTNSIEEKALQMLKDALMKITPKIGNNISLKDEKKTKTSKRKLKDVPTPKSKKTCLKEKVSFTEETESILDLGDKENFQETKSEKFRKNNLLSKGFKGVNCL